MQLASQRGRTLSTGYGRLAVTYPGNHRGRARATLGGGEHVEGKLGLSCSLRRVGEVKRPSALAFNIHLVCDARTASDGFWRFITCRLALCEFVLRVPKNP